MEYCSGKNKGKPQVQRDYKSQDNKSKGKMKERKMITGKIQKKMMVYDMSEKKSEHAQQFSQWQRGRGEKRE